MSLAISFAMLQPGRAQVEARFPAIPKNTEVEIELLENISSEKLHAGQSIPFKIVRPVVVSGTTVMEAGKAVLGEVKAVQQSGSWHKAGAFDLMLKPVRLDDGADVQLDFARPKLRGTGKERAATAVGATLVYTYYFPLIPVALIAGAKKGKPFEIRAGERYLVYVVASSGAGETQAPKAMEPGKP